jgi:predicted small integral membrane protein
MVHAAGRAPAPGRLRDPGIHWIGLESSCTLWQFRHQFCFGMWFQWRLFFSEYEYKGASMRVRLIAVLAVLMASFTLGGCFFHHNQTVMAEPDALPPLK